MKDWPIPGGNIANASLHACAVIFLMWWLGIIT